MKRWNMKSTTFFWRIQKSKLYDCQFWKGYTYTGLAIIQSLFKIHCIGLRYVDMYDLNAYERCIYPDSGGRNFEKRLDDCQACISPPWSWMDREVHDLDLSTKVQKSCLSEIKISHAMKRSLNATHISHDWRQPSKLVKIASKLSSLDMREVLISDLGSFFS